MKNIIIFYPSFERGGATKILVNLIRFFSQQKIKVFLITNNFSKNYKNFNNLKIIKLKSNFEIFKSRSFSGALGLFELFKLINKLNRSETKILSMQSNLFSVLVAFLMRVKILVRVSEDPCGATKFADRKIHSLFILISKLITYNLSTFVVVNAYKSYQCVKNLLYNKNKLKILYNPSLKKIKNFKKKKNQNLILSVGRFCKQKNQILLLNTFLDLIKIADYNYKLIICGDGPDKNKIINFIKLNKLSNKVKLVNWSNKLDKYFNKSSIFVLTSLYEGMPNVLIEAINFNLPCISTNVSGVSDLLLKGKGGVILKNNDVNELKNNLIKISENYDFYLNKTKIAKLNLKKFKINQAAKKYIDLLKKI